MMLKKLFPRRPAQIAAIQKWEYKVVQLFNSQSSSPENASKKLGGTLSADTLKEQFPGIYAEKDGRKQIDRFLNKVGDEGWELIQVENIVGLPLMIFKRLKIES